ncbi:MAG: hypothetical protein Q4G16_04950 [Cruoricaptor ignavus]|nr:hypothetical protein [Cruoricaptor ignavus]
MKKIIATCLLSVGSFAFAQNVSDYEYVYVPKKFDDFKTENRYNLNQHLESKLKQKKYVVITDIEENNRIESCKILTANLKDNSNMFKNRVILELKNCSGKIVASYPAASNIKDFDEGFQDAVNRAIVNLPTSAPQEILVEKQTIVENTEPKNMAVSNNKTEIKANENQAEIYSINQQDFNKINLSSGNFILVKSGSAEPYATFSESTKSGVYRVLLQNGVSTLGYTEANKLIVEIPKNNNIYEKEEFVRK